MKRLPILTTVDGMDGVGKETTSLAFQERLESRGVKVKRFQFPDYTSLDGQLIRSILMGTYGAGVSSCQSILDDALLGALPYAMNRMLSYKNLGITWDSLKEYDIILFDRNYTSNWLYHASKLILPISMTMDSRQIEKIVKWVDVNYQLEIENTWIRDAVKENACFLNFFLYGSIETSQYLMKNRKGKMMGDQIQEEEDLHERCIEVQKRVREMGIRGADIYRALENSNFRLYHDHHYDEIMNKWDKICDFVHLKIDVGGQTETEILPTEMLVDLMIGTLKTKIDCWDITGEWWMSSPSPAMNNLRRDL